MTTSFTSTPNKELLWNILAQNGLFNDLDSNYLTNIKEDFEINIQTIQKTYSAAPILEMNKFFLENMVTALKAYKQPQNYKAEDIKKASMEKFQQNLESKQNNFNDFHKKSIPEHIDFSDNNNEQETNIDLLLQQKQKERELDVQPKPSPSSPTSQGSQITESTKSLESKQSNIKLEIEEYNLNKKLDIILQNQENILMFLKSKFSEDKEEFKQNSSIINSNVISSA